MNGLPELQRLVGDVLVILLQLSGALARVERGDLQGGAREFAAVIQAAPRTRYADEAIYWRARLAEAQEGPEARVAAARDYVELLRRLPDGRLRRTAQVRLAALSEPGALLSPDEARAASGMNLQRIGRALHAYAADHDGRLPAALEGLLGEYLSSGLTLVRPGPRAAGGGRPYLYQPGLAADLGVTRTETGEEAALAGGVPIVVWEAATDAEGGRTVLRLDGEVMALRPQETPETRPAATPKRED